MSGTAVAMIGFPTDVNSSFLRGTAQAPPAIRRALWSDSSNTYAESGANVRDESVLFDAGDVPMTETAADRAAIESAVSAQLESGRRVLSLGGDHSITYPIVRAYAQRFERLAILHFDAHPDLYPSFEGNPYSHASPFARIVEDLPNVKLVQLGIRTMSPKQREIAERHSVRWFGPCDGEAALLTLPDMPVYVSLDLDALDPAFAPGVSHHEPGGLSVRDVIELVKRVRQKIVGADVVELNPVRDVNDMTATVAAKFAKEFIGRLYADAG